MYIRKIGYVAALKQGMNEGWRCVFVKENVSNFVLVISEWVRKQETNYCKKDKESCKS